MSKYAVLCQHQGVTRLVGWNSDGASVEDSLFQDFDQAPRAIDLFQVAINYDMETLWVAPGHFPIDQADRARFLQADDKWSIKSYDDDDNLSSVHAYKMVGAFGSPDRKLRSIIWPEFTSWAWSAEKVGPADLLIAIAAMEKVYGVSLAGSPPIVGRKMYTQHLEAKNRKNWLTAQPHSILEKYPWAEAGKDAIWKRSFSKLDVWEELGFQLAWSGKADYNADLPIYLHAIDKNASYPSGSQSLAVGIGDPVEWSAAGGEPAPAGKPGLWHVWAQRPLDCQFDNIDGPSPLYGSESNENLQEWVTTPLLDLLKNLGWGVQIYEGVYWPTSRRIFEDFAPELWSKRQHFRKLAEFRTEDGQALKYHQLAYDSSKRIINSFFGMFASAKNRDKTFLRRDIWASVVEQAKAAMFYNIQKISDETGLWPIAIATDCLIYASQEPNPCRALGSILTREDKLGGYKVKWSLKVNMAVLAALVEHEVSDMMHLLNGLAAQNLVEAE